MSSLIRLSAITAVLAASAIGLPVSTAQASCTSDKCTGTIELLDVESNATGSSTAVYVDPEGSTSPLSCTDNAGKYVEMPLDTDARRATYQLLLAAFLAGKTVTIKVPNSGACVIQWVTIE